MNKNEMIDSAESCWRSGNYAEAIELCREIHRVSPDEDSVTLLLAWALYDSGRTAEAVACLESLLEKELQGSVFTGFAFDELTRIFKNQKNHAGLIAVCEKALQVQPHDAGLLQELGLAYLLAGRAKEALAIFRKLTVLDPDNASYCALSGKAFFAQGLHQESEEAFFRAAELENDQPDKYFFPLALLFQEAGNLSRAKELLQKCLAAAPDNPLYHCSFGDLLIGARQIKEAFASYDKAAGLDSGAAGAFYNRLGNSLLKAGYSEEAAGAYQTALAYDKTRLYYLNLAAAYSAAGNDYLAREMNQLAEALSSPA